MKKTVDILKKFCQLLVLFVLIINISPLNFSPVSATQNELILYSNYDNYEFDDLLISRKVELYENEKQDETNSSTYNYDLEYDFRCENPLNETNSYNFGISFLWIYENHMVLNFSYHSFILDGNQHKNITGMFNFSTPVPIKYFEYYVASNERGFAQFLKRESHEYLMAVPIWVEDINHFEYDITLYIEEATYLINCEIFWPNTKFDHVYGQCITECIEKSPYINDDMREWDISIQPTFFYPEFDENGDYKGSQVSASSYSLGISETDKVNTTWDCDEDSIEYGLFDDFFFVQGFLLTSHFTYFHYIPVFFREIAPELKIVGYPFQITVTFLIVSIIGIISINRKITK